VKISDQSAWDAAVAANRIPAGFSADPNYWPAYEDMTDEQRGECYSAIVIITAERWADLMENLYADEWEGIDAIAKQAYRDVRCELGDRWSLTGFQYGIAVAVLTRCWEHGEELRRWHNLTTQIGTEGEAANDNGTVLNPALITINGRP
jgi:hypothetical protein